MSWKALLAVAVILAIVMAIGFTYHPITGLVSLVLLMAVGVLALYKLSQDDPAKNPHRGMPGKPGRKRKR